MMINDNHDFPRYHHIFPTQIPIKIAIGPSYFQTLIAPASTSSKPWKRGMDQSQSASLSNLGTVFCVVFSRQQVCGLELLKSLNLKA